MNWLFLPSLAILGIWISLHATLAEHTYWKLSICSTILFIGVLITVWSSIPFQVIFVMAALYFLIITFITWLQRHRADYGDKNL